MRKVRNVHERVIAAPAQQAGALLDLLSSRGDPVFPTPAWPAMRFDRPLGVGAKGGHGPVRYTVEAHEPGRRVRFRFRPRPQSQRGLAGLLRPVPSAPSNGFHELTVEPLGPDRCRVRHVVEEEQDLRGRLSWDLAYRHAHDAVLEELIDNFEWALVPDGPRYPAEPWSPLVRRLNGMIWERVVEAEVPALAALGRAAYDRVDFADAWQMPLRPGMDRDPRAWGDVLPFPVLTSSSSELLLGRNAWHLDFRVSLLVDEDADTVTLSTFVKYNNVAGRLYFAVVRHIHPYAARVMFRRAHRRLALTAPPAGRRHPRRATVPSA